LAKTNEVISSIKEQTEYRLVLWKKIL